MTNNLKLKSLQLNNIGNFVSETIDFDNNLTTLIGKNGTGKTIILKAIALGLLGIDHPYPLFFDPTELLRTNHTNGDFKQSSIGRITLIYEVNGNTTKNTISIKDTKSSSLKNYNDEGLSSLVISFHQHCNNCYFYPELRDNKPDIKDVSPILNNQSINYLDYLIFWLKDKRCSYSTPNYTSIILELISLINEVMPLDSGKKLIELISLELNAPLVRVYGNSMSFKNISTGLTPVIGAISYIFSRLFDVYPNVELNELRNQSAVVLFDTLDSLLHPSLQKHLYYNFKNVFPNIQFIASTHSPLAIAGLNREQIYILESKSDVK